MKFKYWPALAVTIAAALIGNANATPETWTLENAFLTNGTAVTGSFIYDSANDAYSDVSIRAGTTSFTFFDPTGKNNFSQLIVMNIPIAAIQMYWGSSLTNGGQAGIVLTGLSGLGQCIYIRLSCNQFSI